MTVKEMKKLLENYDEDKEIVIGYDEEDNSCLWIENEPIMICYK